MAHFTGSGTSAFTSGLLMTQCLVRMKTTSSSTSLTIDETIWAELAPVPMTATFLPFRSILSS